MPLSVAETSGLASISGAASAADGVVPLTGGTSWVTGPRLEKASVAVGLLNGTAPTVIASPYRCARRSSVRRCRRRTTSCTRVGDTSPAVVADTSSFMHG